MRVHPMIYGIGVLKVGEVTNGHASTRWLLLTTPLSRFEIQVVGRDAVKSLLEKHHYTHSVGKVTIAYGLFDGGTLVGAITYGQVSSRDLAQSIFEGGNQHNCFEFLRMVVLDDVTCSRSWFIARTIKLLRKSHPHIRMLVSFADQTEGHWGYVYQASNWLYTGTTNKKYHYLRGEKRVNKRVVWDAAQKISMPEKDFAAQNGYIKIEELPKFRYIYPLDKHAILKLISMSYPKKGVECNG